MASIDQYRIYIKKRLAAGQHSTVKPKAHALSVTTSDGQAIRGDRLAKVAPIIERIHEKDPDAASKINGWIRTLPLYSVMEMITNEAAGFLPAHEQEIQAILDEAVAPDIKEEGMAERLQQW